MKKTIIVLILIWAAAGFLCADDLLKSVILRGNWERLSALFFDKSYVVLKSNFRGCKSIDMIPFQTNQWMYQAKFAAHGEIGIVNFEKTQGRYAKLKLSNQIKPLYLVEKFKKYWVSNVKISLGDAGILFKQGSLYEAVPHKSLFLFRGEWEFYIKPDDEEEKLTLMRLYKRDNFWESINTGLLILNKKEFMDSLPRAIEVKTLDENLLPLFRIFQDRYGINVKQSTEYWYPRFPEKANLLIFEKALDQGKKSLYYYSFNEDLLPDTQLSRIGDQCLLLSYNARKGLKPRLGKPEGISQLNLEMSINPFRNFISGKANISFENPSSLRELRLGKGIVLNDNAAEKKVNVFRAKEKCYVLTPYGENLSLQFNGNVKSFIGDFEFFRSDREKQTGAEKTNSGSFYFLSKTQNFYPNPGDFFFKSEVTLTLPVGLNCLAPGNLVKKTTTNTATFKYSSPGTKGISLVVGPFARTKKLTAKIPINLYTPESFAYPKKFDFAELKKGADFFMRTYGPLDVSAINILVKNSWVEGGVSNNGFIVVHLLQDVSIQDKKDFFWRVRTRGKSTGKKLLPPSLIRERSEDCVLHELAHQWWGSMTAGKTYQDVWITEGLAHFSVLYYLKEVLPEKRFGKLVKKIKKWVYRYSDSGPITYGTRIHLLEKSYEAYQSIIYNKSALVLLMLEELIGKEEFSTRLRSVLEKYKYKNITTMQFIRQFSGADERIFNFFKQWLYSRALPEIKLELIEDDPEYDLEELKKIVLDVSQLNTDFIIPLKLKVVTRKGPSIESIIMEQKQQKVIISRDAAILSINVADSSCPVIEKK